MTDGAWDKLFGHPNSPDQWSTATVDIARTIDRVHCMLRESKSKQLGACENPHRAIPSEKPLSAGAFELLAESKTQSPVGSIVTVLVGIYVRRYAIVKIVLAGLLVLGCWWSIFATGVVGHKRAQFITVADYESVHNKLQGSIPIKSLVDLRIDRRELAAKARAARKRSDQMQLRSLKVQAEQLDAEASKQEALLQEEYRLIVTKAGVNAGIIRWFDNRLSGYYLLVHAEDAKGKWLSRPIEDAETGSVRAVKEWGVQVPKSIFERITTAEDLSDVERTYAIKHRSRPQLEIIMKDSRGRILRPGKQINQW